jgi:hypothetical protein
VDTGSSFLSDCKVVVGTQGRGVNLQSKPSGKHVLRGLLPVSESNTTWKLSVWSLKKALPITNGCLFFFPSVLKNVACRKIQVIRQKEGKQGKPWFHGPHLFIFINIICSFLSEVYTTHKVLVAGIACALLWAIKLWRKCPMSFPRRNFRSSWWFNLIFNPLPSDP